ncbi:MAG: transposase [Melioribacteraceae bacterium]|nr:transposase [Melioribacteraceae bacterium]
MKEAHFHKRNLPHIYLDESIYFITTRLKDSLPVTKIQELKNRPRLKSVPKSKSDKYYKDRLLFKYYDELLDTGKFGENILSNNSVATIVFNSLLHNHKKDYLAYCFCIMPNHFHIIFRQLENARSIDKIMKSIKGFSAREINKLLNRKGSIWQSESFDHIVRDEDEFYRDMNYVFMNPVKAGLVENWRDWKFTYVNKELFDIE